jgi:hypothetical protein
MNNIKEYTYNDKKKINDKIDKLKKIGEKKDFIYIGKIIKKSLEKKDITEKKNGIWFDLTLVDNESIYKIDKYIKNRFKEYEISMSDSETSILNHCIDYNKLNKIGPKFSKKERNLLNKFKNNYEEFTK